MKHQECDCMCGTYIYNGILLSHKKDTVLFGTEWLDLENMMLSDISQAQEDNYFSLYLVCEIWSSQTKRQSWVEWSGACYNVSPQEAEARGLS